MAKPLPAAACADEIHVVRYGFDHVLLLASWINTVVSMITTAKRRLSSVLWVLLATGPSCTAASILTVALVGLEVRVLRWTAQNRVSCESGLMTLGTRKGAYPVEVARHAAVSGLRRHSGVYIRCL